jgi:hypothetical protein
LVHFYSYRKRKIKSWFIYIAIERERGRLGPFIAKYGPVFTAWSTIAIERERERLSSFIAEYGLG